MKPPPPLNYIRSFECSARHLSFTVAAQELGYTQAAISSHVRALEQYIGRRLFTRYPRSLKLTEMGEAYLLTLRQALDQIDHATEAVVAKARNRTVAISCPVSLAENWLAEVIAKFRLAHPEIEILLQGTVWEDLSNQISDITTSMRRIDDPPPAGTLLWHDELIVVCAPGFLDGLNSSPQDIADRDWIFILGRQEYWQCMAAVLEIETKNRDHGLTANTSNIALELAAAGAGLVAIQRSLAAAYLRRGILMEALAMQATSPWAYYLTGNQLKKSNYVRIARQWIVEQARLDFCAAR